MARLRTERWQQDLDVEPHIEAAEGWCVLHDFAEATRALRQVGLDAAQHPRVLEVCWHICVQREWWREAYTVATLSVLLSPDSPLSRLHLATSLVELGYKRAAFETLRDAALRFPEHETIHYELVCLGCALGRWVEAERWLAHAIEVGGEQVRRRALDDPALHRLWPLIA